MELNILFALQLNLIHFLIFFSMEGLGDEKSGSYIPFEEIF